MDNPVYRTPYCRYCYFRKNNKFPSDECRCELLDEEQVKEFLEELKKENPKQAIALKIMAAHEPFVFLKYGEEVWTTFMDSEKRDRGEKFRIEDNLPETIESDEELENILLSLLKIKSNN